MIYNPCPLCGKQVKDNKKREMGHLCKKSNKMKTEEGLSCSLDARLYSGCLAWILNNAAPCVCVWPPAWLCRDRLSCLDLGDFGPTSVAPAFSFKQESRGRAACGWACYLEDGSNDEHRLVCDLWVLAPTVQSVSKLPAGFRCSRAPEDASRVRPLQVQKCQHVLEGAGKQKVTSMFDLITMLFNVTGELLVGDYTTRSSGNWP